MRVVVAGGSGFVGCPLVGALARAGHDVTVLTRRPERWRGPGRAVHADLESSPGRLAATLSGAEVAYFLVHLLGRRELVRAETRAAHDFAAAAAAAGVGRIVHLGGLGPDRADLSEHMRARRATETALRGAGVPVTVVRAALVVGSGGLSWELLVRLVRRSPVIAGPLWVDRRCQPIALADVVDRLVRAGLEPTPRPGPVEVGGPDVLTYREMMARVAAFVGRRRPFVGYWPPSVLGPLAGHAAAQLTGLTRGPVSALLESMRHDAVVGPGADRGWPDLPAMGFDQAARLALEVPTGRMNSVLP